MRFREDVKVMISHLRLQRERRGWSQATLAKVLGTTVATVAKWEESLSIPPHLIQEVLHLLFGTDDNAFAILHPLQNGMANALQRSSSTPPRLLMRRRIKDWPFSCFPIAPLLCPHHIGDLMG